MIIILKTQMIQNTEVVVVYRLRGIVVRRTWLTTQMLPLLL